MEDFLNQLENRESVYLFTVAMRLEGKSEPFCHPKGKQSNIFQINFVGHGKRCLAMENKKVLFVQKTGNGNASFSCAVPEH